MTDAERKQTVALGTEIVFKWIGFHNVYQLPDKNAFDACDFSKATKLASQGPYTYKASSAGIVYFACEVGGHCSFNQKLALTVTGGRTWTKVGSNAQCDAGAGEVYRSQSPGKVSDLATCQKSCEDDSGCKSITFFNSGWCSHFSTECTKTKVTSKAVSMRLSGAQLTTAASSTTSAAPKTIGWKLGMTDAERKQTVALGTEIVFKWIGFHNVYQLPDKNAFDACDFSKATKLASQGPYTYKASSAGIVYFACEVGGHCSFNQKLALTVTGGRTWTKVGSNAQCDAGAGEVYRSQSPGKVSDLATCQKSCEDDSGCKSITFFNSGWCSHFSTECTKTKTTSKAVSMRLSR